LSPGTYDVLGFQAGAQLPFPLDDGVGDAEAERDGDGVGDELGEAEGPADAEAEGLALGCVPPPYGFAITVSVRFCTPQPFA
jgi:hypothetical protein